MLATYHDYVDLKSSCKWYITKTVEFHLNDNSKLETLGKKTRKHFSEKTKQEIREHYLITQNHCATAKEFAIEESTVRSILKIPVRDVRLSDKGNRSGAGRPLTFPLHVSLEIIAWILELRDLHVPVSVLTLQAKAVSIIRPHNPGFNASRGWVEKCFKRNRLSLLRRTSVSQKLPKQLEGPLTKFYEDAGRYMRIGKYSLALVGNMDETPAFFDMVPSKSICKKGTRECIVRTSGNEKKHVIVILSATADGTMLAHMIIFKGKTEKTIKDLRIPEGFVIKTQKKAWMDEDLMQVWVEQIWLKHVTEMSKNFEFAYIRRFYGT